MTKCTDDSHGKWCRPLLSHLTFKDAVALGAVASCAHGGKVCASVWGWLATVVSGVVTGRLVSCLTTDLAMPDGRLLYVVVGVFCSVSLSGALVCICGKACLGKALCCLPHPLTNDM